MPPQSLPQPAGATGPGRAPGPGRQHPTGIVAAGFKSTASRGVPGQPGVRSESESRVAGRRNGASESARARRRLAGPGRWQRLPGDSDSEARPTIPPLPRRPGAGVRCSVTVPPVPAGPAGGLDQLWLRAAASDESESDSDGEPLVHLNPALVSHSAKVAAAAALPLRLQ